MKIFHHLVATGTVTLALLTLAPVAQAQQFDPPTKERLAFEKHLSGLIERGWQLLTENKPSEALRFFREVHDLNEHNEAHVGGMGLALWELGRKEEAIAKWKTLRANGRHINGLTLQTRRPEARLVAMKLLEAGFVEEAKQIYYSHLPTALADEGYNSQPVRMLVVFDEDDSPEAEVWPLTPERLEAALLMCEFFKNFTPIIEQRKEATLLLQRIHELVPDWSLPVFYLGYSEGADRMTQVNAAIAMERNPLRRAEMKAAVACDFWDGEDDTPEGWVPIGKIIAQLQSLRRVEEQMKNSTFWRH